MLTFFRPKLRLCSLKPEMWTSRKTSAESAAKQSVHVAVRAPPAAEKSGSGFFAVGGVVAQLALAPTHIWSSMPTPRPTARAACFAAHPASAVAP